MNKRDDRRRQLTSQRRRRQSTTPGASAPLAMSDAPSVRSALQFHRAGNLAAAKDEYCRVLQAAPAHPDAWHMLGMVLYQGGETDGALECLRQALKFGPTPPPAELLSNLGIVYRAACQLDAAREALEQAVGDHAGSADSWNNLGTVRLEQHAYEAAEQAFRETLRRQPQHKQALSNLGTALQHQRRYREAQECHEAALEQFPHDIQILNNLGSILQAQRNHAAAVEVLRCAVTLNPDQEEVVINLGRALDALGKSEEAAEVLKQYLTSHPHSATAHRHLGNALTECKRYRDAEACFEQAIALDPQYAHAYSSLGAARLRNGDTATATDLFRQALALRPDLHETHSNLLFIMSNDILLTPEEMFAEHVRWGQLYGNVDATYQHAHRVEDSGRRLRIGYVSPDLRDHAVARFLEPVLAHHDTAKFEVYCYAQVFHEDATTTRLKSLSAHWRSTCGYSYRQVAETIYEDQIDVLVDLAGHTASNRLLSFAFKPAPVQVTWLGYENTTGLPAIDYRLTSEVQDPIDDATFHTERLVRLPWGANCYAAPAESPPVASSPVLRNGWVTFGSIHRPQRIATPVFRHWADVLQAVPGSRLRLFNTHFNSDSIQFVTNQLLSAGIEAARFSIGNQSSHTHYLGEYDAIDIGLDVFPWNGGTTTREALWMGVPVIGLLGDRRSSRGTAATLHYSGLSELIARSSTEYVTLAAQLAEDVPRLSHLRATLRSQLEQTICNAPRFTQSLEDAFLKMWEAFQTGREYCHLQVRFP